MKLIRHEAMTIALDARDVGRRGADDAATAGEDASGQYLTRLYRHVLSLRPWWEVIGYHRYQPPQELINLPGYTPRLMNIPGDQFNSWQQVRLPMTALLAGVDYVHCSAGNCPRWVPKPTIVTVNDLNDGDDQSSLGQSCMRATAVICTSNHIAHQLQTRYPIEPSKVHVCPWGATIEQVTMTEPLVRQVMDRFRVTRPFVLHFSSARSMSDTMRLLESWSMLPRQLRSRWQLLIVDLDAKAQRGVLSYAGRLGVDKSVVLHGCTRRDELPVLYGCAWILSCPGSAESISPLVLNAFTTGTAVLTSNDSGPAEVAGDAAVKVQPGNLTQLSDSLARLMKDSDLRDELVDRGRSRVRDYTWQGSARRFIQCTESIGSMIGRRRRAA